ncbi:MAG: TonB-dependent receptor plug domain-containing protein, partial [Bacteroidia bacterium]|nr:TonB-dependent receptor plug domain-containing protein [Bacteroidia bacterium]
MKRTSAVIFFYGLLSVAYGQLGDLLIPKPVLQERIITQKIELASRTEQSVEEAPAVVSVLTREEIERYGARDIADVLRRVPGFEFGIDVGSLIGVGFRGIWAHEGKMLIMLNGQIINDLAYGNYNFISTLPVSMIERIEILRGPASCLYGGFAEIGALNIITSSAYTNPGVQLHTSGGIQNETGLTGMAGIQFGETYGALEMNVSAGFNTRPLSNRAYTDFFDNQIVMSDSSFGRNFTYLTTSIKYKNLEL